MNAVNDLCTDIHCGMEAKGNVSSENIVVNGFGQSDYVKPLLRQNIRGLVGSVSAEGEQAVKL